MDYNKYSLYILLVLLRSLYLHQHVNAGCDMGEALSVDLQKSESAGSKKQNKQTSVLMLCGDYFQNTVWAQF